MSKKKRQDKKKPQRSYDEWEGSKLPKDPSTKKAFKPRKEEILAAIEDGDEDYLDEWENLE